MIVTVPVDELFTPADPDPPVTFPTIVMVPVLVFLHPNESVKVPPVTFPVMFTAPVEPLLHPKFCPADPPPPVTFPVIVKVPLPELAHPVLKAAVPAVIFPTIDPIAGEADEKLTQVAVPANTFAVNVIPLFNVNDPPAVALPVVSLRTSATVVFTFSVIVNELAIKTSAFVNVGNRLLAVPLGVVAQTSVAFTFPVLRAK